MRSNILLKWIGAGATAVALLGSLVLLAGCSKSGPVSANPPSQTGTANPGETNLPQNPGNQSGASLQPGNEGGTTPGTGTTPGNSSGTSQPGNSVPGAAQPRVPTSPDEFQKFVEEHRPNELGKVMILEYHGIGLEEQRWVRRYDNFRRDLETLYNQGYRLISLRDYLDNNIQVPAGKMPVVLTFDDSRLDNFNYIEKDGKLEVDPKSAVGILLEFYKEHPDFGLEATFYINFPYPFRQKEYWRDKVRFLIEKGMDVGNHTYYHENLSKLPPDEIRKQLGLSVKTILELVPGYEMDSLALPFGAWPKDRSLVTEGEYEGVKYRNRGVLLVGAHPAPSPIATNYDPLALPRIQAIETELEKWYGYFEKNPLERYVSDGDPNTMTYPAQAEGKLNRDAQVKGKTLKSYNLDK